MNLKKLVAIFAVFAILTGTTVWAQPETTNPERRQHAVTLMVKAEAAVAQQHWLQAEMLLKRAKRLDPYNATIFDMLGHINTQLGRTGRALNYMNRAETLRQLKQEIALPNRPIDHLASHM